MSVKRKSDRQASEVVGKSSKKVKEFKKNKDENGKRDDPTKFTSVNLSENVDKKDIKPFDSKRVKSEGSTKFMKKDGKKLPFKGTPGKFNNKSGTAGKFNNKQGAAPTANYTKADWQKMKEEKKKLKLQRKQKKFTTVFDTVVKSKKIDELLRRRKLKGGDDERKKLISELHEMNKGNYEKLISAHDTVRIVQHLFKYSPPQMRNEIAKEITPHMSELIVSKFGRFLVERVLKYGSHDIRSNVIEQFYGNVLKLCCQANSTHTFAEAYSKWASPVQKQLMQQEFYGKMYQNNKDKNVKCLKDCYENTPSLKDAVLKTVKANLSKVIDKGYMDNELVHSVLLQYTSEAPESLSELTESLLTHVVVLANTKDGAKVVMKIIWNSTNKDKKSLLKKFKEHIVDMCKHENAYATVITVLDAVDDTIMVSKLIVSGIVNSAHEIVESEWGRKVIAWLFSPNDTQYFHPKFIAELKQGYDTANCKKPKDQRRKELFDNAMSPLLTNIEQHESIYFSNASIAMVTLVVLKKCDKPEQLLAIYTNLANIVCQLDWTIVDKVPIKNEKEMIPGNQYVIFETKTTPGIEHSGLHVVLKKLLRLDKTREDEPYLGKCVVKALTEDVVEKWIQCNRGCFLLLTILETNPIKIQKKLCKKIKPFKDVLYAHDSPGAKLLKQNYNDLMSKNDE